MASVLIVEDNADLREMYAAILGMRHHSTRTAETATEAMAEIAAARPDVVVLDLGIMGGVEAEVAALRAGPPAALILASGAHDLAERACALGAMHLVKPFTPDALVAAVARAIAGL